MAAEWIKRRKAQMELDARDANIREGQERLASQTIVTDGPVFWDAVLPELNEQCADMEDLGFQARAYTQPNPYCLTERTYRIDVQTKGHFPIDAFIQLIHFAGSSTIKVTGSIPKLTDISLCVTDRGIRAVSNKDMELMDPAGLAEYLLSGLVEAIERKKRTRYEN